VRARNSNLLFATCYDPGIFNQLKSFVGRHLSLSVDAAGDVVFAETAEQARPFETGRDLPAAWARGRDHDVHRARQGFNPLIVGEKSCNQTRLRDKLPDWIKQPASIALPFGALEHVLSLEQNKAVAEQYNGLRTSFETTRRPTSRIAGDNS